MTMVVVRAGLTSPGGITPRDHVFFLRANLVTPAPSPFVADDDKRIDVRYCSWLGGRLGVGERLTRMARAAVHEVASEALEVVEGCRIPLLLCTSRPRPGLAQEDLDALEAALRSQVRPPEVVHTWGAAGAFAALREASSRLASGAEAVMVVAADSHVHVDCIEADLRKRPSWWAIERPPLSEAAAAVLLMDERAATRAKQRAIATIQGTQIAASRSTDEDDEVVDGVAMTTALRGLPIAGQVRAIFGQYMVDNLRRQEWMFAEARTASRYHPDYANVTVETRLGRLGAAAGLFNVAYGASVLHHDATEREVAPGSPALAWAISRDGTRGVATLTGVVA